MIDRLSLVIPVADEQGNPTLPTTLETVAAHAPWLDPVLVGTGFHLESYLKGFAAGSVVSFNQQAPHDPIGNTTRMLRAALNDPGVSDPFVWSNDDIYFLEEVTVDDVAVAGATARGKLEDSVKAGRYGKAAWETRALLVAAGRPTWDYERHVPLLVHKAEMATALAIGSPGNPRSLYQNHRFDAPAFVLPDVKLFSERELPTLPAGKFFSTGNRFPIGPVRRVLGLA